METRSCLRSACSEGRGEEPRVPPLKSAKEAKVICPPPAPLDSYSLEVGDVVTIAPRSCKLEELTDAETMIHSGDGVGAFAKGERITARVKGGDLRTQGFCRVSPIVAKPPSLLAAIVPWDREGARLEKAARSAGNGAAWRLRAPFSTEPVIAGGGASDLSSEGGGNDTTLLSISGHRGDDVSFYADGDA
ncbi:hypothetical protein PIB30_038160 [Stylosanthes scabra]|uniref:Uncharacterized protein n=1 Tax=Stylosanthes scabra TaxID=79078 RepID=A0ABU6XC03_9FABA|nr:hypothetical protein [Stylosanthes scabra]